MFVKSDLNKFQFVILETENFTRTSLTSFLTGRGRQTQLILDSSSFHYNGVLVPVRTSWHHGKIHTMYQRKVDVDMLNTVKSVLADVSSISPSLL